jgi:hypothetical protein
MVDVFENSKRRLAVLEEKLNPYKG